MPEVLTRGVQGHRHGRVPRAIREQQLIEVAERLFAEHGYHRTSIDLISEAAGVTRPMVYNYFISKDGIYLACLRKARNLLEEKIATAVGNATSDRERIEAAITAYLDFFKNNEVVWELLYGRGVAAAGPAAEAARSLRFNTVEKLKALLQQIHSPDFDREKIEAFAHMMSGGGEQLAKWWKLNPGIPRTKIIEYFMTLFWTGYEQILQQDTPV